MKRKGVVEIKFISVPSSETTPVKAAPVQTPITPTSVINIEFSDNTISKKEAQLEDNATSTPPTTAVDDQQKTEEKEQPSKPKSYRDAIGKKEKVTTNENQSSTPVTGAATGTKPTKSNKQKSSKSANRNSKSARGHPQDTNDYYDDSWYYGTGEEGYLHTGYTDDQEVFVGNLSAQVTEQEVKYKREP